jgi:hypothetical protein
MFADSTFEIGGQSSARFCGVRADIVAANGGQVWADCASINNQAADLQRPVQSWVFASEADVGF